MDLVALKLAAAAAIFAVAIVGGAIPLMAARLEASRRLFSLVNALAGGIFLGIGFIHLLPEGMELLGRVVDYPLGALLGALGVVVLLLIDRVLFNARKLVRLPGGARQALYPFVLLLMLSIHSIFAGVALGIAENAVGVTALLVGVLSHKGSAAFALMAASHAAALRAGRQKAILGIFAAMTPGGVLIGLALASLLDVGGETAVAVEGCFNALAAGTFIYVAITDIIDAELPTREDRTSRFVASALIGDDDMPMPTRTDDALVKFALIVLGIAAMALLGDVHAH